MSQDAVNAFAEKVKSDQGLQQKIRSIDTRNRAAALAKVAEIAAAEGFQFSAEEAAALARGQSAQAGAELNLDELEKIAGGGEDGFSWEWGSESPPGTGSN